jgi:hypothetical protein
MFARQCEACDFLNCLQTFPHLADTVEKVARLIDAAAMT